MSRLDIDLSKVKGTRISLRSIYGQDISGYFRRESRWKLRVTEDIPWPTAVVIETKGGIVVWGGGDRQTVRKFRKGEAAHMRFSEPAVTPAG